MEAWRHNIIQSVLADAVMPLLEVILFLDVFSGNNFFFKVPELLPVI